MTRRKSLRFFPQDDALINKVRFRSNQQYRHARRARFPYPREPQVETIE
jgi:hypothetical protein